MLELPSAYTGSANAPLSVRKAGFHPCRLTAAAVWAYVTRVDNKHIDGPGGQPISWWWWLRLHAEEGLAGS